MVGTVEGCSGGFEFGVGFVSLFQNFLRLVAGQAFLSCELQGFES